MKAAQQNIHDLVNRLIRTKNTNRRQKSTCKECDQQDSFEWLHRRLLWPAMPCSRHSRLLNLITSVMNTHIVPVHIVPVHDVGLPQHTWLLSPDCFRALFLGPQSPKKFEQNYHQIKNSHALSWKI